MKAISLWQPWATTPLSTVCRELGEDWEVMQAWTKEFVGVSFEEMPLGALLCVVNVVDCVRTELVFDGSQDADDLEFVLGNYEPGRFAWKTSAVKPFSEPIPWKGSQGFFDVPADLIREALRGVSA